MSKPLLFISHKHADKLIAGRIAAFVRDTTLGLVDIFLSSDAAFQGPRFGRDVNLELRRALWNCDVLALIYTSEDRDWSYCMWECGVATDPNKPDANIVVFQCGADIPGVLRGSLRVNVRDIGSLQQFCRQFFTQPGFFPSYGKALAENFEKQQTDQKAEELLAKLSDVIPRPVSTKEWTTWPFVQVTVPLSEVVRLKSAAKPEMMADLVNLVREKGVVSERDSRAPGIFGLANLDAGAPLRSLASSWQAEYPGADANWFDSCCQQIAMVAAEKVLRIQPALLREAGGVTDFLPVVSRVRQFEWDNRACFDMYFYDFPNRQDALLADRMITPDRFYWLNSSQLRPGGTLLTGLNNELKSQRRSRIPILDENLRAKYIIHRSMIDQFIVEHLDDPRGPAGLTLEDLLADEPLRNLFGRSFAVVARNATLEEARSVMKRDPDCRDIFVTAGGTADEPVVGWLTNVDLDLGRRTLTQTA